MGMPINVSGLLQVSALQYRAYNLIWNEWFRDENLQNSVPVFKNDGPDDVTTYKILPRGKRHDYFTSALPWPQKGPGVEIPVGGKAPVFGNELALGLTQTPGVLGNRYGLMAGPSSDPWNLTAHQNADGSTIGTPGVAGASPVVDAAFGVLTKPQTGGNYEHTGLYADLDELTNTALS